MNRRPLHAWLFASLLDDRGGIHREPPFVILGPEMKSLSVRARLAADVEVAGVESRAHRPKLIADDLGFRQLMAQEVEQQGRDERPVDDQPGILLDLRDVAPIVMNAVAVKG